MGQRITQNVDKALAEAAADFAGAAARMRARLRRGTDSESLVREGRDGRFATAGSTPNVRLTSEA
ncbi:hypothetical protein [Amaricoccus sp.]|uniref:hypothetical protein n=1 Tax=Amaricoccus sp. TaxID=1872485 RepID=UPI001B453E85|nr:hypothetical protein [Amaricoccus sp.]MBP7002606.1 hypothetical protein [Amaricoccus sp.]